MPALANTFLFSEPDDNSIVLRKSCMRGKYPPYEELRFLYWDKKLSMRKIATLYGVNHKRIYSWMIHLKIKRRTSAHPLQPIFLPSPALAHVLGVLYGDGFVCEQAKYGNYIVGMRTVSKIFAEGFAASLTKVGLHPFLKEQKLRTKLNGKEYNTLYVNVRAHSKLFLIWFNNQNNDSLYELLKDRTAKIAFLRGLYESEGSFGYWKRGVGRQWVIRIVMLDKEILSLSKRLFHELGYQLCLTKSHKTSNNSQLYSLDKHGAKVPEIIDMLKPCIKGENGYARAR